MKFLKIKKTVTIIFCVLLVLVTLLYPVDLTRKEASIGVTFSNLQAERFGLDWKEAYTAILDDLKVKYIRIPVYWDAIEREKGELNFDDIQYQLTEAEKRNVDVILAIGYRVPRWPECFAPIWTKRISGSEFEYHLLAYLEALVKSTQKFENISYWQVENEPYLNVFGLCPPPNRKLFEKEIDLVKSLDDRPIIVTDSGELSLWSEAGRRGDVFGTSMYVKVWNKHIGYFEWILPAVYYPLKFRFSVGSKPFFLMELQAEPWGSKDRFIGDIPTDEQLRIFNEKHLRNYLVYARKAGFDRIYLWGVEWWYWMREMGHPQIWEEAKTLWQ